MDQAELYSSLMDAQGHIFGWIMILLVPLIVVLGYRKNSSLLGVLFVAWALRTGYATFNTYVHTAFVDDFETYAYIDSGQGIDYILDGFGVNSQLYTSVCSLIYLIFGRSPLLL